jgi:DNA topoisomerase-3
VLPGGRGQVILYIAEKPSLGRAIAEALPQPQSRGDGFITVANGDVVSWCIGHLLEQAEPEAYDPAYKKWAHQHLPIIPERWQLIEKKQTAKQLRVLRKLVKQADSLVHAGDPDREGQLLVDEVFVYFGLSASQRSRIKRCLISDLNLPAVRQSLAQLRDNREFVPLSTSALARSRADWLYGINMTRAYTLQGQKVGYRGVLSVGRVQTPLLGLVVRRDEEIDAFESKPYFEVWANLRTEQGEQFKAKWQPSEHCARFLDESGRNLSKALAENVASRISMKPAKVACVERTKKREAAPLPSCLSSLQIDCSKAFGMSAQEVLDLCQSLYEKHKAITYPRSDCRYLPEAHFAQAAALCANVQRNLSQLGHKQYADVYEQLDVGRKSRAWNDAKVDAHHAIIPTSRTLSALSEPQVKVYSLICRNYLAQFLPFHEYFTTRADIVIESGLFIARAKELLQAGWKRLYTARAVAGGTHEVLLPRLSKGQQLESLQAEVIDKLTTPPKHFTDGSLLAAMTGISAFVVDKTLRKVLRETDGLGTEATRAGIIELLFKRGFLLRNGKSIRASDTGKALIHALPEGATLPDMTARWESTLTAISHREAVYDDLMVPLTQQLGELVGQSQAVLPTALAGLGAVPRGARKSSAKKTGKPRSTRGVKSGKKPRTRSRPGAVS